MGPILHRRDSSYPFQEWRAFDKSAIVQVWNAYGDTRIGDAASFWWGYEHELGGIGEGVITRARRLDRPRAALSQEGE